MGSPTPDSAGAEPRRRPNETPNAAPEDRAPAAYRAPGSASVGGALDAPEPRLPSTPPRSAPATQRPPVLGAASAAGQRPADVPPRGMSQTPPMLEAMPDVTRSVAQSASQTVGSPAPPPQLFETASPPAGPVPGGRSAPDRRGPLRKRDDEAEHPFSEAAVSAAPPWLVSSVVHLLLVILLGLWMIQQDDAGPVRLEFSALDEPGEFDDQPLSLGVEDPQTDELFTPEDPFDVEDPFSDPPELRVTADGLLTTSPLDAPHIGPAFTGRDPGVKEALLRAYGGNAASEAAVLRGLEWLVRQQQRDGSWSLVRPYSDSGQSENRASATAMAMLAFQGAGHTHQSGQFKDNVSRGLSFLLGLLDKDGNFYHGGPYTHWMYTQAQCTIALSELYGMTKDPALKRPAQLAVRYCEKAQDRRMGGWRYEPGNDSDMSVTGWVVMALQSARMAGLEVDSDTLRRVDAYLDRVTALGAISYSYQPGRAPSEVMTAEALLCRQYLGWRRNNRRLIGGVELLLDHLPTWNNRNVYYWYYATQVMHHMEGDYWVTWNNEMRDLLVEHQVLRRREAGSWHPFDPQPDHWAVAGGRLYVTCLSLYILEVYYRHLPLYSQRELRSALGGP